MLLMMVNLADKIDYEALRQDLTNESMAMAIGGIPAALLGVCDAMSASEEGLLMLATAYGIDINKYSLG